MEPFCAELKFGYLINVLGFECATPYVIPRERSESRDLGTELT